MRAEKLNRTIIGYLVQFDAKRIGIFGSVARGEETPTSDLDLLVSFKQSLGILQLVRMERELSELMGRKVGLVTERALTNAKLEAYIRKDLQIIYE